MMFIRPQHNVIAKALSMMDGAFLLQAKCYFGGGTAIVLQNGEYRLSLDVDFLCADQDGYRELRTMATEKGIAALFGGSVEGARDVRADQYGIRGLFKLYGQPVKFEIVREARVALEGDMDNALSVPVLTPSDQFAQKLLANADRGLDRATSHRDAIDLGMLVRAHGVIPATAIAKAEAAYGSDVARKVRGVLALLDRSQVAQDVADAMEMVPADVVEARDFLHVAAQAAWPNLFI